MTAPLPPPFPLAGEAASLGAALIWSCSMSIFTKYSADIPAQALNLFKTGVAITCLLVALALTADSWPADPLALGMLAASGIVGISLGDTALFVALKRLGAQITASSQCLAPPIAAVIAAMALGENLTLQEALGMLITTTAVSGIILFGRRSGAHLSTLTRTSLLVGIGFAIIAAVCQGAGLVMTRHAFQGVDLLHGTLTRIVPAAVVLTLMLFATGQARQMSFVVERPRRAAVLAVAAFGGTFLGILLMSAGVKWAKAGVAGALTSTYPIWIIPIAHFGLRERITWQGAACTVVAVCGIVLMLV